VETLIELVAPLLFVGMLAGTEVGRRVRARRAARDGEPNAEGLRAIEGAIFALFGLLLAFTFSDAAARFDERRRLINQETNDLGTLWLRLDVLPTTDRAAAQDLLRRYLDSRLSAYGKVHSESLEAALAELAVSQRLQAELWACLVQACASGEGKLAMLVLPAANAAFDTASTRLAVSGFHPPGVIFALLFALGLLCAALVGWGVGGGKSPELLHRVLFAGVVALTMGVIVDVEYPRLGFIRVESSDQLLTDLRASMR
jgi:hypothetical protein